ncbi:hypothetical protein MIND_00434000 [Mycena indigotica]|uniref:Uncharacterized protein n=1 Tax=Mycena indigotica TaxID=2126181 RepID=A0A8H6SW83_9AGAR|nr:uncharacterized protein MIND_00434000 [Mycena indigotica]KAF7306428.1 hypothetical protein MIND_00434000 [Mycena indigotica]
MFMLSPAKRAKSAPPAIPTAPHCLVGASKTKQSHHTKHGTASHDFEVALSKELDPVVQDGLRLARDATSLIYSSVQLLTTQLNMLRDNNRKLSERLFDASVKIEQLESEHKEDGRELEHLQLENDLLWEALRRKADIFQSLEMTVQEKDDIIAAMTASLDMKGEDMEVLQKKVDNVSAILRGLRMGKPNWALTDSQVQTDTASHSASNHNGSVLKQFGSVVPEYSEPPGSIENFDSDEIPIRPAKAIRVSPSHQYAMQAPPPDSRSP